LRKKNRSNRKGMMMEKVIQWLYYSRPFQGKPRRKPTTHNFVYSVTLDGEFEENDPITIKLATYTMAHRNYLQSISEYEGIAKAKINWGLRRIRKIEE
jgi:hypothetical protein